MSAPIDLFIAFLTPGQKPLNYLKWEEENFLSSVGEAEKTFLKIWIWGRRENQSKMCRLRYILLDAECLVKFLTFFTNLSSSSKSKDSTYYLHRGRVRFVKYYARGIEVDTNITKRIPF